MLLCMYCLVQPLLISPLFAQSPTAGQVKSQKILVSGIISDGEGEKLAGVNVMVLRPIWMADLASPWPAMRY